MGFAGYCPWLSTGSGLRSSGSRAAHPGSAAIGAPSLFSRVQRFADKPRDVGAALPMRHWGSVLEEPLCCGLAAPGTPPFGLSPPRLAYLTCVCRACLARLPAAGLTVSPQATGPASAHRCLWLEGCKAA